MSVKADLLEAAHEVQTLFTQLMALPAQSEAFYHQDQVGDDGKTYRIFLYRLGSYTDFLLPGALESRGIMFRHNEEQAVWELVSRPMTKFFNWKENPFTMEVDLTKIQYATVKEDGSLISTYSDMDWGLSLKTKGSLRSEQAVAAMNWLYQKEMTPFRKILKDLDRGGWTVNMEWTSPLNRIVIPYQVDKLIVLNVRHRLTGGYMEREYMEQVIPAEYLVPITDLMVEDVAAALGTEGLVAFFGNGAHPVEFMKVKADAYQVLHRLKDGVNQPHALFEAVVHEQVDDLRASFAADPSVQLMISTMEELVSKPFNHFVAMTTELFEKHKDLDKKSFAITMQEELAKVLVHDSKAAFNVSINMYLERNLNMVSTFIRSAQDRVVAEYRALIVERLTAQGLNTSNTEINQ